MFLHNLAMGLLGKVGITKDMIEANAKVSDSIRAITYLCAGIDAKNSNPMPIDTTSDVLTIVENIVDVVETTYVEGDAPPPHTIVSLFELMLDVLLEVRNDLHQELELLLRTIRYYVAGQPHLLSFNRPLERKDEYYAKMVGGAAMTTDLRNIWVPVDNQNFTEFDNQQYHELTYKLMKSIVSNAYFRTPVEIKNQLRDLQLQNRNYGNPKQPKTDKSAEDTEDVMYEIVQAFYGAKAKRLVQKYTDKLLTKNKITDEEIKELEERMLQACKPTAADLHNWDLAWQRMEEQRQKGTGALDNMHQVHDTIKKIWEDSHIYCVSMQVHMVEIEIIQRLHVETILAQTPGNQLLHDCNYLRRHPSLQSYFAQAVGKRLMSQRQVITHRSGTTEHRRSVAWAEQEYHTLKRQIGSQLVPTITIDTSDYTWASSPKGWAPCAFAGIQRYHIVKKLDAFTSTSSSETKS